MPAVNIVEVDRSQPTTSVTFSGTPPAVIGTAQSGPAFVPTLSNSEELWHQIHGEFTSEHWGSIAVKAWYNEAQANASLVYLRVLGAGDGKKRNASNNSVTNAGFVVGEQQIQTQVAADNAASQFGTTVTVGAAGANPFANEVITTNAGRRATNVIADPDTPGAHSQTIIVAVGGTTVLTITTDTGVAYTATPTLTGTTHTLGVQSSPTTTQIYAALAHLLNQLDNVSAAADGATSVTITADTAALSTFDISVTGTYISGGHASSTAVTGLAPAQSSAALGRTYFLSTLMSQSEGSTYLEDAGLSPKYQAVLRGVILVASGVELTLSGWHYADDGAALLTGSQYAWGELGNGKNPGGTVGAMRSDTKTVKLIFNGLKLAAQRVVEVSLDTLDSTGHMGALNTDFDKFEETGHYLYAHYPVPATLAVPSTLSPIHSFTMDVGGTSRTFHHNTIITTGSSNRNQYGASGYKPNFEGFEDRFATPFTPWVTSQEVGGTATKLFRFHALDDGEGAQDQFFAEISNIKYPEADGEYAKFDISVRAYGNATTDQTQPNPDENTGGLVACSHTNVTLDPNDDNYIARVIGDYHRYYNFDVDLDEQKLVLAGQYENTNRYVRVEVTDDVSNGRIDPTLVPFGFQGMHHLVTSGSTTANVGPLAPIQTDWTSTAPDGSTPTIWPAAFGDLDGDGFNSAQGMVLPPLPYRNVIKNSASTTSILPWGIRFDRPIQGTLFSDKAATATKVSFTGDDGDGTQALFNGTELWSFGEDLYRNINTYFPSYSTSPMWVGDNIGTANTTEGIILDADQFNNNKFTLGRVYVATETVNGVTRPDGTRWHNAYYVRNGVDPSTSGYRFLIAEDLKESNGTQSYTRFVLPFQGGFDGLNLFNSNKRKMNHHAAHYEQVYKSAQGGLLGPTVAAYRKAIDILTEKTDVDINALAIPGQRSSFVTDHAAESMEERFDAVYLMDPEILDGDGSSDSNVVFYDKAGSQKPSTFYTIERFASRGLNSSFAAAYYPNVNLQFVENTLGPGLGGGQQSGTVANAPASIAALAAFSLTARREGEYGTPAGYDNGRPKAITGTTVDLTASDVSDLYIQRINPIAVYNDATAPVLLAPEDTEVAGVGVIQGQKTLLQGTSALNRLDVRKLMIFIRRSVRKEAEKVLFEPNQPATLATLSRAVTGILDGLVAAGAVEQFRVVIDDTTTSQADIENNTVRGKVFVKPFRSVEIISIDINIENAGAF